MRRQFAKTMWLACFAAGLMVSGGARASQLITEEEAKLPPPKGAIAADRRGILRGPKVEFTSPEETVHSPLHLQLKFQAFGGAKIDPESVKVIFLRTPNVDLTPRVKPFIQAGGIDMPDTGSASRGDTWFARDIKDSDQPSRYHQFRTEISP